MKITVALSLCVKTTISMIETNQFFMKLSIELGIQVVVAVPDVVAEDEHRRAHQQVLGGEEY